MSPRISVLVPFFNEAENVDAFFRQLERALAPFAGTYEVIAVDDGSTDGTREMLVAAAEKKTFLRVIGFRTNVGQTAAFDAGFRHARGEVIVTIDSDLQNDPDDIPKLLSKLDEGFDFVAGWRRRRRDPFLSRTLPSRVANSLIRWVAGTKTHDLGCSLKAYRREVTRELRLYGEMHRFIGVLLEGMGARVTEVEVSHHPRRAGRSKYGIMRTFKVMLDLLTVRFLQGYRTRPSHLFGGIGMALIGVAALVTLVVAYEKLGLGIWVHRNPKFVIAAMLSIIGVQFLVLGLLAELVIRTYFEASHQLPYSITVKAGTAWEEDLPSRAPLSTATQ